MTPARIARILGLVGLAAFLGLAARTSTATPAFDDDQTPPPPPTVGGASLIKDPKPVLVSRVDAFPFTQDEPEPSVISPAPAPDELIPPHEPAAEGGADSDGFLPLPDIPPPPSMDSKSTDKDKEKAKPAKEAAPEVVPAPLAPVESADDAPPIAPAEFTGDDFPGIAPTPEPLSIDPAKAPKPAADVPALADPVPAPKPAPAPAPVVDSPVAAERPKAWRAERDGSPARSPVEVAVEIDEVPAVVSSDPDVQARSFVERNQREAEERLKALQGEAEELRGRLTKLEAAIQQWRNLADAMKKAQVDAAVKAETPRPKPESPTAPAAEAAASLEPQPAPRQAALVAEPHAARAQDVPAPPLR